MVTGNKKNVKTAAAKVAAKAKGAGGRGKPRARSDEPGVKKTDSKSTTPVSADQSQKYIATVGRRKTAVARLRFNIHKDGKFLVNDKGYKEYFPFSLWQEVVIEPLPLVGLQGSVDITVKVNGGGLQAQAEAIRLALSRALIIHNPDWRPTLRKMGFLTRDPREKERKKPGLKRARRAPQWQKR